MSAITEFPLQHPSLCLYVDNSEALLFHRQLQKLFYLDATSVWLLLALDEGQQQQKLVQALMDKAGIDLSAAQQILHPLLAVYNQLAQDADYSKGKYPELAHPASPLKAGWQMMQVAVGNTVFTLSSDDPEVLGALQTVLAPIQTRQVDTDISIEVSMQQHGYDLHCNGLHVESADDLGQVVPMLIERIQILSYQSTDYLFCFHGAALQFRQRQLLLPGVSGAGKSTLSALLCARRYQLYSDEMIVLDQQFRVQTLSLPIALKQGSWELLASDYPQLRSTRSWLRRDGKQIKYLWPGQFATCSSASTEQYLLNPSFKHKSSSATLAPLSAPTVTQLTPFRMLQLMTQGGYQVSKELNKQGVLGLIDWLNSMQGYQLCYQAQTDIVARVESLCSKAQ